MSDLMIGLDALEDCADEYLKAQDYYEGTMFEYFVSPRMRRALLASDIAYRVRLAAIPVDAVADRLEIAAVTVADDTEMTSTLTRLWDDNELLFESPVLHLKTCMYGDTYLIVWPTDDGESVEMYYNSPLNVRIIYDEERPRVKRFAIKCWELETKGTDEQNPPKRVNLYYTNRIEKYITKPNAKGDKDEDWIDFIDPDLQEMLLDEEAADEDLAVVENPYGEVPVFHFRTSRPYGIPEHEKAYGPQDIVNKLVITQMATIDYQGFPQRFALAETGTETEEGADFGDDDVEATELTGQDADLKSGPGELWNLTNTKAVGQFDVAEPDAFLKPLDRYVRLMASVTNTPLHYFDPMGDSPSGEALRAKEAPLVKRIKNRMQSFASSWAQAFQFALKILEHEGIIVDVRWTAPASIEDRDGWETAKVKRELGVPPSQLLLEGGYTQEQVTEWKPDEQEEPEPSEREDDDETS